MDLKPGDNYNSMSALEVADWVRGLIGQEDPEMLPVLDQSAAAWRKRMEEAGVEVNDNVIGAVMVACNEFMTLVASSTFPLNLRYYIMSVALVKGAVTEDQMPVLD